jgi:hypothetical protein
MELETEQEILSEAMRILGSRTSEKKAAAARENGKKGGRPKKEPAPPAEPKKKGRPRKPHQPEEEKP